MSFIDFFFKSFWAAKTFLRVPRSLIRTATVLRSFDLPSVYFLLIVFFVILCFDRVWWSSRSEKNEGIQDHAQFEKNRLHTQRIVSPNQLCEQLVGRAIDLKINPVRFERHMRALWVLLLVPIGKLAPRTLGDWAGAGVFYGTLTAMTFLGIEQERFLNSLG